MQDTLKTTLTRQWRRSGKKPKIVVDTNLFVSGLLASGPPSRLIDRLTKRRLTLCTSGTIFEEYSRVIHRFGRLSKTKRDKLLGKIRQHTLWVHPTQSVVLVKADPKDNKFLECAIAAHADFLVSGDSDLINIISFERIPIVTLSDFNSIMGWD